VHKKVAEAKLLPPFYRSTKTFQIRNPLAGRVYVLRKAGMGCLDFHALNVMFYSLVCPPDNQDLVGQDWPVV